MAQKVSRFIYATPAILCCLAMLCGVIPSVFCLDGRRFAFISLAVFGISILLHIYILFKWRTYADHAPLGYAIILPCNHLIILWLALMVGATSMCGTPYIGTDESTLIEYSFDNPL